MLKLFKPRRQSLLGIDISSTSIKIIEISGSGQQHCVNGYASKLLPLNAVEGNTVKDIDAIAYSIKQMISSENLTSKNAVLAVPDSAVISKTIQINEGLNDSEMEEFITMEAEKYIPYPVNEVNLDFEVIGPAAKNASLLDVLIVASRSENVNSRVEAVKRAGLEVLVVDVESFAVERTAQLVTRALPAQGKDKVIAIIDIGALYSHFFVLHGMKMIFTREEEFGGKQLIDATSMHYGVSFHEAMKMNSNGSMPADYAEHILNPFREMLQVQIKRALQFFFSTSHYGFIDHILLAGGVAKLTGLAEKLEESTGIPVSIANPFEQIEIAKTVNRERLIAEAPSLIVACGLALREVY
ncbi:Tfp pilus assembly protein, ATPase PilM [Legionella quinlivanii]|uniref:Tfp pilus assembly protein, ATPase PilM n=1 Tax=Legionella quinlivanii TaxID=45073 RepID=A0A0W0Y1W6_9GAMM|nr:type IV pilus assembly protein PilM [Legionella quinlivanii]KTD50642.1 Tfp pilus assembly protein, ATPase PilM [Legionella quinlivanii]SEG35302.1 type IV pilus assembly protein PilM [Legionella quinlivanii DSM 21216]STY11583.1 type IV pilus assembly protein PilM [Legionella quinlivanii]